MGSACSAYYQHLSSSSSENLAPEKSETHVATIEKLIGVDKKLKKQSLRSKLSKVDLRNSSKNRENCASRSKKSVLRNGTLTKNKVTNVADWTATVSSMDILPKVFTFKEYKQYLQARRQSGSLFSTTPVLPAEPERCKTAVLRKISPKEREDASRDRRINS